MKITVSDAVVMYIKRIPLILLLCILLSTISGSIVCALTFNTIKYTVSTTLLISNDSVDAENTEFSLVSSRSKTFMELVRSSPVLERSQSELYNSGYDVEYQKIYETVDAEILGSGDLIKISYSAYDCEFAALAVSIIADSFSTELTALELGSTVIVDTFTDEVNVTVNSVIKAVCVSLAITFFVLSIFFLCKDILNPTMCDEFAVEAFTGCTVVASILTNPKDPTQLETSFDELRMSIISLINDKKNVVLSVLSPDNGVGSRFIGSNLAVSLSKLWRRTVLVDADFLHPGIHSMFSVANKVGLSDALNDKEFDSKNYVQKTAYNNLSVITVGNADASYDPKRLKDVFNSLKKEFDYVIVCCGATASNIACTSITDCSDYGLISVKCGNSSKNRIDSIVRAMKNTQSKFLGAVAYNCRSKSKSISMIYKAVKFLANSPDNNDTTS